ncbi:MAG TPA: META domain-containing protein [Galbitalea sp.]
MTRLRGVCGLLARRRMLAALTLAIAGALVLSSCATAGDHGGADPRIQGQWQLTSATDAGGTIDLLGQTITLTIDGDTDTTGRSSCSDYHARFLGMAQSLWVTATLPHTIDCGSALQQSLEMRYMNALNYVRSATVTGGVLDLLAPGIDLHYVRALFHPMTRMIGHVWSLSSVSFLGFDGASATTGYYPHGVALQFNKNGTLRADSTCTTVTAHYIQNAGQIVADHVVVHTIANCDDPNSTSEDYVLRVVDASFSFSTLTSGQLAITSPRVGVTLGFDDSGASGSLSYVQCLTCTGEQGG